VLLQHAGAGAGRRHDVVVTRERGDGAARDRDAVGAIALVIGGLAAAGLARHLDPAAGALEQLHRSEADRGAEQVDQTGDEQGDARLAHGDPGKRLGDGMSLADHAAGGQTPPGDSQPNSGARGAAQLVGITALGRSTR
jgi:hypothetical protein